MYGPTETTIWSTVSPVLDPASGIPIGHAIANTLPGDLFFYGVTLGQKEALSGSFSARSPRSCRLFSMPKSSCPSSKQSSDCATASR